MDKHNYYNCHNITCRRKCEDDGYNQGIQDFYDKVLETTDYAPVKKAIQPCHRYYPIPDSEVAKSKYILDNKEYEQYGF